MAVKDRHSTLNNAAKSFDEMIKRFGIVTVMNAKVYDCVYTNKGVSLTAEQVAALYEATKPLCTLDTLKIANISVEGPDKTVTGGQYSNPLIKFGKNARLEMQDALGNAEALAYLGGAILEWDNGVKNYKLHMGDTFVGPKTIIGDSFFIEQKTGAQVPVKIIIYQMLPDSIFNLTQDAEGDASVFDLNGDLLATKIKVGYDNKGQQGWVNTGLFYSILEPVDVNHLALRSSDAASDVTQRKQGTYKMVTQHAVPAMKTFNTGETPIVYNITSGKMLKNATAFKNKTVASSQKEVVVSQVVEDKGNFVLGDDLVIFGELK